MDSWVPYFMQSHLMKLARFHAEMTIHGDTHTFPIRGTQLTTHGEP
jgi:hypothetical protein